jgi:hypothetical protein
LAETKHPRKLFWDTETSLMVFAGWQPGKQYVGTKQIIKEREVVCIGYAFDEDAPQVLVFDLEKYDFTARDDDADRAMLEKFSTIYSQADLVIGHNIKAFDIAVVRSRLIRYGLPDLAPVLIDDTLSRTKAIGFSGHSLDYISRFLGVEEKKEHPYELWMNILLKKDPEAMQKMVTYCGGDVAHNRDVYKRLLPYIGSSLNLSVFHGRSTICPNCGKSGGLVRRGHRYGKVGKYNRYFCKHCKTYPSMGTNLISNSSKYPR